MEEHFSNTGTLVFANRPPQATNPTTSFSVLHLGDNLSAGTDTIGFSPAATTRPQPVKGCQGPDIT